MRKINYENKQFINADIGTPNKNKVTDNDMNEIKAVVNANADELQTAEETITQYVSDTDTRLGNMQDEFDDIESDITEIQGDIVDINSDISDIQGNTYTKTETDNLLDDKASTTALGNETTARENADTNLQRQIDSIVASSDVVDIVGTYQELLEYDTSKLGDNDIIKVLDDSTHNDSTSYYRWKKHTSTWEYIGSEGPYYTKSQTDSLLNDKVDKVQGKGLSENDFTDTLKDKLDNIESGAEVNKIEGIKLNGITQAIINKIVDIITYEKPNTGIPKTDLASDVQTSLGKADSSLQDSDISTSITSSSTNAQVAGAKAVYDYVGNVVGDINSLLDQMNREVV